jgi:hypothetical protein
MLDLDKPKVNLSDIQNTLSLRNCKICLVRSTHTHTHARARAQAHMDRWMALCALLSNSKLYALFIKAQKSLVYQEKHKIE